MKTLFLWVTVFTFQLIVSQGVAQIPALPTSLITPLVGFQRESRFNSITDFISAIQSYKPDKHNDYMAYQFSIIEPGQPEEESTGQVVRASRVDSCLKIWVNDDFAIIFAVASPVIPETPTSVGVIFVLHQVEKNGE